MVLPGDQSRFERRYGMTPDEALEEQRAELETYDLDARMHIVRALNMAESIAPDSSPLAIAIAARQNPDTVRMGATFQQLMGGSLAAFYSSGGLARLVQLLPIDGEAMANAEFLKLLIFATIQELNQGLISDFPPYRFLYERLVGTRIRPFLPSAFLAAASLPRWTIEWRIKATAGVEQWDENDLRSPPLYFPLSLT